MSSVPGAKSMPELYEGAIRLPQKEAIEYAKKWRREHGQHEDGRGAETLCWSCQKACGSKCSWSRNFTPVEGWDAEETIVNAGDLLLQSYRVNACPEFAPDREDFFTVPNPCPYCHRKPVFAWSWGQYSLRHCLKSCNWHRRTAYKRTKQEAVVAWNRGEVVNIEHETKK